MEEVRYMSELWQIDHELGEVLQPHEREIAEKISSLIVRAVKEQGSQEKEQPSNDCSAKGALARRDVHSKAHGCVKAEFKVEESLPTHLAQGAFVPGVTYSAWIRFS